MTDSVQQQLEDSIREDSMKLNGTSGSSGSGEIDHRQKRKRDGEEAVGAQKRMKTESGDRVLDPNSSPVLAQVGETDVLLWMQQQQRSAPKLARPFFKRLVERLLI